MRQIETIPVVDEVPMAVRSDPRLVDDLDKRHGLRLTHFASHYLSDVFHWYTKPFGHFGRLNVRLVDPLDTLSGMFFSRRPRDFGDLQTAWRGVDRFSLQSRVRGSTRSLRSDERMLAVGTKNWYVLTGDEKLP